MKLMTNPSVRYSYGEIEAFKALGKKKRTTNEIARLLYGRGGVLNANQSVVGVMRSLQRKVELNDEPFRVVRSERRGPYPISFWLEKREHRDELP